MRKNNHPRLHIELLECRLTPASSPFGSSLAVLANPGPSAPQVGMAGPQPNQQDLSRDDLGALWDVLALTKNADQAPWLSRQFGQGQDATALHRRPQSGFVGQLETAWQKVMDARPLIVQAVALFDAARQASDPRAGDLVHQGNRLLQQAGELVQAAEQIWSALWNESLNQPRSAPQPETPPQRQVPWDVWVGLTQAAQAQEMPPAPKPAHEEAIPWAKGRTWQIYTSKADYENATGHPLKVGHQGAVTFQEGPNVITVFASPANMRNPGLYAHEKTHMVIFTGAQYQNLLGNDLTSLAKREQLAYFQGMKAAEQSVKDAQARLKAAKDPNTRAAAAKDLTNYTKTLQAQTDGYNQATAFLNGVNRVYNFIDGREFVYQNGQVLDVPPK
jgi:hypothetical protein